MMNALWTAATGMHAQELNINTISNNLANVNTTGFKQSRAEFEDLIYQQLRRSGAPLAAGIENPVGLEGGHGVKTVATQRIFTQGDFRLTENPLDLVIEGDGFFQVLLPNGSYGYTRDGAFKKDRDGTIVTSQGYRLQPEITIPPDAEGVTIGSDGSVSVVIDGQVTDLGVQIQIVRFVNPGGLAAIGKNILIETQASGPPLGPGVPGLEGRGTILQGFLEMSNVKAVEEMVNMIVAQRAYEMNSKSIQTSDAMLQVVNQLKR